MTAEQLFERSFTTLFHEQAPPLFRYMARLTGDTDMAADLIQETFVRLYERGELPENIRAWLVTVATNLFRDQGRTASRRTHILTRFDVDAMPSAHPTADMQLEQEEQRSTVNAALSSLPERDRQLLLLRYEGYSYQEIAQAIGIAASSVGTLLIRATSAFHTAYLQGGAHAR